MSDNDTVDLNLVFSKLETYLKDLSSSSNDSNQDFLIQYIVALNNYLEKLTSLASQDSSSQINFKEDSAEIRSFIDDYFALLLMHFSLYYNKNINVNFLNLSHHFFQNFVKEKLPESESLGGIPRDYTLFSSYYESRKVLDLSKKDFSN